MLKNYNIKSMNATDIKAKYIYFAFNSVILFYGIDTTFALKQSSSDLCVIINL